MTERQKTRALGIACLIAITLTALAVSSSAAITPISPPPPGEGDTVAIVAAACQPLGCIRLDDADAIDFSSALGIYYGAAEDRVEFSDRDFNDLIWRAVFSAPGVLQSTTILASYTAAQQSLSFDGMYFENAATGDPFVATSSSNPALNFGGQVQMAFWRQLTRDPPPPSVPEPSPLVLLGLIGGAWFCHNLLRRPVK